MGKRQGSSHLLSPELPGPVLSGAVGMSSLDGREPSLCMLTEERVWTGWERAREKVAGGWAGSAPGVPDAAKEG